MGHAQRLLGPDPPFSLQAAGRLMTLLPAWVQDLALLVESVEAAPPPGAHPDWQPGAVVRLPYSKQVCGQDDLICSQALMALADAAMVIACSAAWNGYRPMTIIDQTSHFVFPANFDVIAEARIIGVCRNTSFGRIALLSAIDKRPLGTVASAYSMH